MRIKNAAALAVTGARKLGLEIIEAGLAAIATIDFIKKNIRLEDEFLFVKGRKFSLKKIDHLFVIGIGKGSILASATLAKILGEKLTSGIALDVQFYDIQYSEIENNIRTSDVQKLKILTGSHPLPSKRNIKATQEIIKLVKSLNEKDLLITFISGGGSALLCASEKEMKNSILATKLLTQSGADILELNTVRKHLSELKGGGLAKLVYPATVVSLIVSDVLGNDLSTVASGPTVYDKTTKKDAIKILRKYIPRKSAFLSKLVRFLRETPKKDKYFEKVSNIMFISNKDVLRAMKNYASQVGYKIRIVTAKLQGEAKEIGRRIAEDIKKEKPKTVLLYGGETTVKVLNKEGKGGRNQELALSALKFIGENETIIAFASDGRDNTDVAGAIVDKLTQKKVEKLDLDIKKYLTDNNSYEFFQKTGDYIFTGDTGSNVSDLIIAIKD